MRICVRVVFALACLSALAGCSSSSSKFASLGWGEDTPPPANSDRLVNSVPDQYLVRAGAAYLLSRRIGVMGAYRLEGQRRYDLIGQSHGFRRPGVAMFIEPGVSFNTGPGAMWVALPVSFYVNRKPDPYTGIEGDATFPKVIFLVGYQFRLGGRTAETVPVTP
jgi:hypothetical protein